MAEQKKEPAVKDDKKVVEQPKQEQKKAPDITAYQRQIDDLKQQLETKDHETSKVLEEFRTENDTMRKALELERQKREAAEIRAFCEGIQQKSFAGGKKLAPAALSADLQTALLGLNPLHLIEFAEEKKQSQRAFWQDYLLSVLEMAADNKLFVPLREEAADAQGKQETSVLSKQDDVINEYMKEGLTFPDAYKKALAEHGSLFD